MREFLALCFMIAAVSVNGSTIVPPPSNAKVKTLPNGLTVIVEEDRSAPVASVQAWCATGSIHEGTKMGSGLSHILEHMLFKGTERRKAGDIAKQVQDQGGYINAYTTFDRTVYWIDVPASGAATAVEILADAMMNATLPPDEYEKEQEVIRREFAMGFDDPNRMSSQLMFRTAFQESPYRHPVIGYLDVYNQLTRDDVMAYYKTRYVPNNLTFVVTGDVDAEKIFSQLEKYFADYPREALEPVYVAQEAAQLGRRDAHEEFPTELTRMSLAWKIPGLADPDVPALDLLSAVLGDGRSSPLYQQVREKKQLVHQISAGTYTPEKAGLFVVQAVADPGKREAAEAEILALIEQVKQKGVNPADLEKAKKSALYSHFQSLSTARGKASDLGSNWLLARNVDFSREYFERLSKVTPADLQRVAQEYLVDSNLSATSLSPVGSLSKKSASDQAAKAPEIQKFTLPNGLRLLVREDPRLPLVSLAAVFRGGLLSEVPETNGVTSLLARTIIKGTKKRSASEISGEIEAVGGSIDAESGNNSFTVGVEVMKPDLALGVDLLADVLQNPTFPVEEVDREKQVQIAGIKAEEDQITAVAAKSMREALFGDHPYALRSSGTIPSVQKLNREALQQHFERLVVGRNGVISVFGDVKAKEVVALFEKAFSKMPAGEEALADPKFPAELSAPVVKEENRDKKQAVIMVGYQGVDAQSKDRAALELIEEASSDLGSRFFARIRDEQSLAYFVGAAQFYGIAPGFVAFYLGTDPKKAAHAKSELLAEIKKLAQEGLTEEELARAKEKRIGSEIIRNQSNAAFARAAAIDELLGLGFDHYKGREKELRAVTLEDTREVARKYLGSPGFAEIVVRPQPNP